MFRPQISDFDLTDVWNDVGAGKLLVMPPGAACAWKSWCWSTSLSDTPARMIFVLARVMPSSIWPRVFFSHSWHSRCVLKVRLSRRPSSVTWTDQVPLGRLLSASPSRSGRSCKTYHELIEFEQLITCFTWKDTLTPPCGFDTSPYLRGIICTCRWGIVCPPIWPSSISYCKS